MTANGFPVEMAWTAGEARRRAHQDAWVADKTSVLARPLGEVGRGRERRPARPRRRHAARRRGAVLGHRFGGVGTSTREQVVKIASRPSYPGDSGGSRREDPLLGVPQTVVDPPGGVPPSISTLPGLGALGARSGNSAAAAARWDSSPSTCPGRPRCSTAPRRTAPSASPAARR
ncbi:hypothetical protein ACU686_31985 [Yinghuangia aomiensis]